MTIEERFAHIPDTHQAEAVAGFVAMNRHLNGIDFHTMMEMVLDADAHMPILGDVVIDEANATALVDHFRSIAQRDTDPARWYSNGVGQPQCTGWLGLDVPVGELMGEAGPNGWTEIVDGLVRLWRPFNWAVGE